MLKSQLILAARLMRYGDYHWEGDHLKTDGRRAGAINPFEDRTGMFLELATTAPTKRGIIEFCRSNAYWDAELSDWKSTIKTLKTAVENWQGGLATLIEMPPQPMNVMFNASRGDNLQTIVSVKEFPLIVYTQCNIAIAKGYRFNHCERCGRPFMATRTDRQFCGSACRVAVHREQQSAKAKQPKKARSR